MTKISQIDDRSAAAAWSPARKYGDVIALGAKDSGTIGFDDTGGELELYDLNLSGSNTNPVLLGSVKTQSRFSSLDWSSASLGGHYAAGVLAGGMENGSVHVWNPQALMSNEESVIATYSHHSAGPVKALQFNNISPSQLATGGSDGQVYVTDLEQPEAAFSPGANRSQITSLAWNPQVGHILASASADGAVAVWDVKSRKAWCELRGETAGHAVADVVWNPSQGLHLLTASADDRNPVLKLWDLRASTSMPLATLEGHQQGILSTSWCPHDEHLLLSCGKDNRTILWDMFSLRPLGEIPNDATDPNAVGAGSQHQEMFAGGLASSQQRRYDVQWSPINRGIASTCSLDRKVQAHSIMSLTAATGRPPKWMRPSGSVSCGFGGTVISSGSANKIVQVSTIVEEPEFEKAVRDFEMNMESANIIDYCLNRSAQAVDRGEAQQWAFMRVIFETNARQQLLDTLGFDPSDIAAKASSYTENDDGTGSTNNGTVTGSQSMSAAAEDTIKKALLVGNFEAAVECCFRSGNLADALVLASCGGSELWTKTQQRYFESQSAKRPFLSVVSSIIHNQLDDLVQKSDPAHWQETLAILSTYGKSEEFPQLCIALGDLLDSVEDSQSATLCHMCALSLPRAVKFWRDHLASATAQKGSTDYMALHEFVVKLSVFMQAVGPTAAIEGEDADLCAKYAAKVAEQGMLVTAAKYSRGQSLESKILRDRLYRSRASPRCLAAMGGNPPEFPFSYDPSQTVVKKRTVVPVAAAQPEQGYTQEQTSYQSGTAATTAATDNHYSQSSHHHETNGTAHAAPQAAAPVASDALPDGWMELHDPSSGRSYYANQTTGEVTWDKPQITQPVAAPVAAQPVAATPSPAAQPMQEHQQQEHQQHYHQQYQAQAPAPAPMTTAPAASTAAAAPTPAATPSRTTNLVSKYGDGFVTSASHPELAYQYGNVGTSNPYTTTARPGIAAFGEGTNKAPVSGTLDMNKIQELREEYHPIRDCLLSLIEALEGSEQLTAVEKRLIGEAKKAVAVLLKRLTRGDVSDQIGTEVLSMCGYITSYDFRAAQSVQTALVNSDWKDNKDWLKGVKALLQLATKKYGR